MGSNQNRYHRAVSMLYALYDLPSHSSLIRRILTSSVRMKVGRTRGDDVSEENMTTSSFTLLPLAERPDLAGKWAELHWHEWGDEPGREQVSWWVADAVHAVQRTRVPLAVLALGPDDQVLGGVGLHEFDVEARQDRSPWVVGTIVRPGRRGQGIGHTLMASLEAWAASIDFVQIWVATGIQRIPPLPSTSSAVGN
jgi:GNAT superfamily N-acetyltransferase